MSKKTRRLRLTRAEKIALRNAVKYGLRLRKMVHHSSLYSLFMSGYWSGLRSMSYHLSDANFHVKIDRLTKRIDQWTKTK